MKELQTDTDTENCKTSLEESTREFNLQDVTSWRCFKEVADVLGEDNAEYELGKVLRQINDNGFSEFDNEIDLKRCHLISAFDFDHTPQGDGFWESIYKGIKPEGYDSTPDIPPTPEVDKKATPALKELMKLNKDNVEGTMEVRSQTLGELVEAIQINIPPHIGIHFQPDGEVLLEADNAYVVVSELTAKEIDSAIEFVANYGHLVIGKNDVQD